MAPRRVPSPSSSSSDPEGGEENPNPPSPKPTTKEANDELKAPSPITASKYSESDGSEEEDDEEDDDEGNQPINSIKSPQQLIKPKQQDAALNEKKPEESDSGSESESGSSSPESDSPPIDPKPKPRPSRGPDPSIKPITSKPMDDTAKLKKITTGAKASAAAASPVSTPTKLASSLKRPAESNGKDSKRKRGAPASEDEEDEPTKRHQFSRLWGEEDEIAFLKCMIDSIKRGSQPWDDLTALHESVKSSIHFDVSRGQISNKIRTLKKKYHSSLQKGSKGKEPVFGKAHDKTVFDLSKKIWGKNVEDNSTKLDDVGGKSVNVDRHRKAKEKTKAVAADMISLPKANSFIEKPVGTAEEEESWCRYPYTAESLNCDKNLGMSSLSKALMKNALGLVSSSKMEELEDKWRKVHMMEMKVCKMRAEVIQEQLDLFTDALKTGN